jgi:NADP-dependent 3-hydroxy acid dehydrogenase YdfG
MQAKGERIMKLDGRSAIVTGGGTGIGLAVSRALASEGCRVAVTGRREETLRAAAEAWRGHGALVAHAVDVADRASVAALMDWANDALGPIDILVNNAGINIRKRTMAELIPEDWDRIVQVIATGAYNCLHAVLPEMRSRGDGLIVNICSIAGKRASPLGGVAYTAAKFAQAALGACVALEVGECGVRVSNIFPGEVDTPLLADRPVPVREEHRARILQPEDVAAAVLMIACLPPRAHVAELIIKPTVQAYA